MKSIIVVSLFLLMNGSFAQSNNEATIDIVGKSKLSVMPDVGVLNLYVNHIDLTFGNAITGLNEKTDELIQRITSMNFNEDGIATTDFRVVQNYVRKNNQRIDSGFVASQALKVEFKNEKSMVQKILVEFSQHANDLNLNFTFKLSSGLKIELQEKLIDQAYQDALQKAERLANNSNMKLGVINSITYGKSNPAGMFRDLGRGAKLGYSLSETVATEISGFTPQNIEYSDTVHIVWQLK